MRARLNQVLAVLALSGVAVVGGAVTAADHAGDAKADSVWDLVVVGDGSPVTGGADVFSVMDSVWD